jgi:PAS domain S-box-containing protein
MKDEAKSTDQLLSERRQLPPDLSELQTREAESGLVEASLREALAFTESIVETVREPLLVLDASLRVVSGNPAFYRTFKVAPQETEGRFIYELGNRQWDIPELRELLEKVITQEIFFEDFEVEHEFPNIGRKCMLLNARLIPGRGKQPRMILLAIEDITERKQAHEALRKAYEDLEERVEARTRELALANLQLQKEIEEHKRTQELLALKAKELARSNSDLEQFAYLVSHDLQEPLHVVAGFLKLIHRRYKSQLDAKAEEFIGCALDSICRLEQQIKDLLDYSRVTTRGKEFELVDVNAVVDQVLKDLNLTIKEKKAKITWDPLPKIMADSSQLPRVFQNLIGNAIKFSGNQPPRIHIGARESEGEWQFWVQDQGIGIDPKNYDRIFLMFERLHPRSEYPGTGIGLAICKRIIKRHGGHIWVESEPGQGSTFYFTIPAYPLKDRRETDKPG